MSRSRGGTSLTTLSPILISPSVTSSRPASMRRAVDLPQPDGPTRTMNSVSLISRLKSLTASVPPANRFVTCSYLTDAICALHPSSRSARVLHGLSRCAPELGRRFLRARVAHECAGSELDPGEVLEAVAAPVWRVELEMQVCLRPFVAVGRGLVDGHHVGGREPELAVVRAGYAEESPRQVPPLGFIEVGDRSHVPARVEVHLERPAGGLWDEGDHRALVEDETRS